MMESLGDNVRISSIHGGEEECGLVALSTNQRFVVHNRNLGGTPSGALSPSQSLLPTIELLLTAYDEKPFDDASQVRRL
jgi:hypothetical protein